jgi:hypothetical protein
MKRKSWVEVVMIELLLALSFFAMYKIIIGEF